MTAYQSSGSKKSSFHYVLPFWLFWMMLAGFEPATSVVQTYAIPAATASILIKKQKEALNRLLDLKPPVFWSVFILISAFHFFRLELSFHPE